MDLTYSNLIPSLQVMQHRDSANYSLASSDSG